METLITITELVEITKIKERTIRKYVLDKKIPYLKVMGFVRFRPSEIEKWIEGRDFTRRAKKK